jgi:hypothetical protein
MLIIIIIPQITRNKSSHLRFVTRQIEALLQLRILWGITHVIRLGWRPGIAAAAAVCRCCCCMSLLLLLLLLLLYGAAAVSANDDGILVLI